MDEGGGGKRRAIKVAPAQTERQVQSFKKEIVVFQLNDLRLVDREDG